MEHPPKQRFGAALRWFFGVPFRRQTYRNVAYLALAFPLGILYLVGLSIGLSAGLGLVTTLAGIPLLVATLAAVVGVARFEAKLASWLLDMEIEEPRLLHRLDWNFGSLDDLAGTTRRLLTASTTWTGLVLVVVRFGFGVVAFTALVAVSALGGALLTAPVFYDTAGVVYVVGSVVVDTMGEALGVSVFGVIVLTGALHVLNGLAKFGGFTTTALVGERTPEESPSGGA